VLEVVEGGPQRRSVELSDGGREFMGEGGLTGRGPPVDGDPDPSI
jgi:hypothetical protein